MSILVSLLLCILFFMSGGVGFCIKKERQALLEVKGNLTSYLSRTLVDWGSEDCCEWTGVTCSNHTGHVVELFLGKHYIFRSTPRSRGNISSSIQELNELRYLELKYFDFQLSPLPNFLGSLSKLEYLYISDANLGGPIPRQLANLSNLRELDLSRNSLWGSIPFSFGDLTSLTYLNLSQNQLGGVIPRSFENSSSLVHLDLSVNHLNGSLPSFFGCSSLITLSLTNNFLNGGMPDFTRGCLSLQKLDLSYNILSGNIHNSLGQLPNLDYLDVGYNSLNGSIPNFIGSPSLRILDMSSNNLSGNVPNSLGKLSKLEYLDISYNSLIGAISVVHLVNLTQLDYLDLSLNSLALDLRFNGSVPFQLSVIRLQSCRLGPRFPMWIQTQKYFSHLDISNAEILDNVPDWFWHLPKEMKFLNLSSNQIEGNIPYTVFSNISFTGFPGMDLSNNHFEGEVHLLPSRLSALNLSGNRFSGTLSFLCAIEEFLTFLDLSNNSFTGNLPNCWIKFHKWLVVINLSNNNLSGNIPSLGTFHRLEALYLRANRFVGEVPMSLSNCRSLRFIDLSQNKLSGIIPEWKGEDLPNLFVLVLGSNKLSGNLSSQLCSLYNLQVLDLSNNALSGDIPRCFDKFKSMARKGFEYDMGSHSYNSYVGHRYVINYWPPPSTPVGEARFLDNAWVTWKGTKRSFGSSGLCLLKSIDLSRNNLSGIFPHGITLLYELVSLNLSFNKLHGEIPKDIGRLKYLESLDLSRNKFSGRIPSNMSELTFLNYLDLSFNNLSGRIPSGPQLQLFDNTSYKGNSQLCGPPLTLMCGLQPFVENKTVEEDEDECWKSYYTGMGVGFSVGYLGICGALVFIRRCRYFIFASLSHMKDWIYVFVVVHFGKLERKLRR